MSGVSDRIAARKGARTDLCGESLLPRALEVTAPALPHLPLPLRCRRSYGAAPALKRCKIQASACRHLMSAWCAGGSREDAAAPRSNPAATLTDLPETVLHMILGRIPGRDAARMMSLCKALAAAVRRMPEIHLALDLDASPAASCTAGSHVETARTLQVRSLAGRYHCAAKVRWRRLHAFVEARHDCPSLASVRTARCAHAHASSPRSLSLHASRSCRAHVPTCPVETHLATSSHRGMPPTPSSLSA